MKRRIFSIYLKAKNIILSMKEFKQIHLMDEVIYRGKKCFVNNGTRYDENGVHYWDILEKEWNKEGTRNKYYATDKELKRVLSWFNIKNALFSRYNWWKKYWYQIELRKMLEKR